MEMVQRGEILSWFEYRTDSDSNLSVHLSLTGNHGAVAFLSDTINVIIIVTAKTTGRIPKRLSLIHI